MPGDRQWYVVQTYASYENRVEADLKQRIAAMNMQDKIFNVLVPTEKHVVIKDGQSRRLHFRKPHAIRSQRRFGQIYSSD